MAPVDNNFGSLIAEQPWPRPALRRRRRSPDLLSLADLTYSVAIVRSMRLALNKLADLSGFSNTSITSDAAAGSIHVSSRRVGRKPCQNAASSIIALRARGNVFLLRFSPCPPGRTGPCASSDSLLRLRCCWFPLKSRVHENAPEFPQMSRHVRLGVAERLAALAHAASPWSERFRDLRLEGGCEYQVEVISPR